MRRISAFFIFDAANRVEGPPPLEGAALIPNTTLDGRLASNASARVGFDERRDFSKGHLWDQDTRPHSLPRAVLLATACQG
jgi:hypothetical protein